MLNQYLAIQSMQTAVVVQRTSAGIEAGITVTIYSPHLFLD